MSNEEVERAIEFILKHQAQQAALQAQYAEQVVAQQKETERRFKDSDERFVKLAEAVIALTGMVGKIADAQTRADERIAELAASMAELTEKGKETEERLNAFILYVERFISERRNGRRKKSS
ncbi:MAG TPA: hypothetical protein VJH03_14570 [Blastocatellia bacterium]|nr:hypothetical protein [Blastocatellia bacterium]